MSKTDRVAKGITGIAAKSAASGLMVLALAIPGGWVSADSSTAAASASVSNTVVVNASSPSGLEQSSTADPAKAKFTKEQAIAKVRELFPELKDAEVSNVQLGITNVSPAPSNQMVWDIQWSFRTGTGSFGFSSQVDAINGDLISTYINLGDQDNESYYPPALTRDQALEKAKAFITKAATSISADDLEVSNSNYYYASNPSLFGPAQYGFYFTVKHGGISSAFENVTIGIDGNGLVKMFNKSAERWNYPTTKAAVSAQQAEQTFKSKFDVELVYIPVYGTSGLNRWVLGWKPVDTALYPIDASSGSRLSIIDGTVSTVSQTVYADVPQLQARFTPRSSSEEITNDEAVQAVKKIVTIPTSLRLNSSTLFGGYTGNERKVWNLFWIQSGALGGMMSQTSASVDALTGQIISYNKSQDLTGGSAADSAKPKTGKLTYKQSKDKAIAMINKLYPNASSSLKLAVPEKNVPNADGGYGFQFIRFVNGIRVDDGGIVVTLDGDGNLVNYYTSQLTELDGSKLKRSDVKISKDDALAQLIGLYTTKLQYQSFGGYGATGYTDPVVKLVYAPVDAEAAVSPQRILDAVTGVLTPQFQLQNQLQNDASVTDIKGNPAEEALSTLVKYNILVPDESGKVKPDAQLTTGEWLTWMGNALTAGNLSAYVGIQDRKAIAGIAPDSSYYPAVAYAAQNKWIASGSAFNPDTPLTREQFAVLLTSLVGYDKFSAYLENDPSVTGFSDAAQISRKGEVAVAVRLGLLEGQIGKFNPAGAVTRADAAKVIMKLVELQGKTDQTIGQTRY
ncbi:S-layer homology domain-containing protein [Paenibacillus sp. HN-1]|uniref:S-layer homology domain-containing protein n=1 Tax=Paenibacillus TaxID=44249 RepID=UPI001CA8B313|nr:MULTISPECIES: S-layer homology domain-containing protein [Paenibacillus]MBY9078618.1 S-layer homology domain-containing protein [Paenibacillus sp. CGMCC 1.18879]MBY9084154.1 S-layer homology domain-containing protein [Paenibacillus sinensis]